jgi:hypothetical protein
VEAHRGAGDAHAGCLVAQPWPALWNCVESATNIWESRN